MKTKISLTTCMAIAMLVNSTGQTNTNQFEHEKTANLSANAQKDNIKSITKSDVGPRKILSSLEHKESSTSKTTSHPSKSTSIQELIFLSDELSSKAQTLRITAKNTVSPNQQVLLEEAKEYEQKALVIQLQICEMTAELNLHNYQVNKISIQILIKEYHGDKNTLVLTYNLIYDSEKEMKLAKELREEAKAQPNLASIIGSMGNAEEKELVAIHKQSLAINVLTKSKQSSGH